MVRPMISMEMTDEEKHDWDEPAMAAPKPDFPYGLRLCFTTAELEKLDIDMSEAFVGGIFHMHALCTITSVSSSVGETGKCDRVEVQVTAMNIESEDAENETDGD